MSDEPADIVALFPDSDTLDHERPLHSKDREYRGCFHHRTELDGDGHRAYCKDCGVERPLWDVLNQLAREPERYVSSRKALAREEKRLRDKVEELKRQERNVKGRLRKPKRALRTINGELLERYVKTHGPITEENAREHADRLFRIAEERGEFDGEEES